MGGNAVLILLLAGVYTSMFLGMFILIMGRKRRQLSSLGMVFLGTSLSLIFMLHYLSGTTDVYSYVILALGLGAIVTGLYDILRFFFRRRVRGM